MDDTAPQLVDRLEALESEVRQLRRVQECTAALISSLDLSETLDTILRTALDVAGARQGSVLLYEPGGAHLRIVNAVGLREETIRATRIPDGEGISGRVAKTGQAVLVEDIDADPRFSERRARASRSRSFASLPLAYRGRPLGAMNLSHPPEEAPFRAAFLPLLTSLAHQAAVAIAHAEMHRSLVEKERFEQRLDLARAIHESFIPPVLHITGAGFEFAGRSESARSVGGDFYDVVELPGGGMAFFVGDVSGKGVPAALYMARLLSDLQHAIGVDPGPAAVLAGLNEALFKRGRRGMFVTLIYGTTGAGEDGRVRLASAGHPPPIVRRADGAASPLVELHAAAPLGILTPASFEAAEVELLPGEVLLLYSDGATEAANPAGREFTAERLAEALEQAGRSADSAVDFLVRRIGEFRDGGPARDDVTFLALRAQ
ncbi:MAG: SpoIIE family protein phosphatase [Candidatus Tectomicrobia bacterium]|uniref:SpoIIE family protein phosphatase n=1 Tax=Tectimicrobiota bacterium TaxID=2528274 RepID=A0A932ZT15_UNCTE|nr:SpoIIE family protein phosphatase [Candidatus Tectomicrobia bacterium]